MITEKGAIAATGEMNKKVMFQAIKLSVIAVAVTCFAILLFFLSEIFMYLKTGEITFFVLSGILVFVVVLSSVSSVAAALKRAKNGKRYEYEFNKTHVKVTAYDKVSGVMFAEQIIEYRQMPKMRETKDYLFFYITSAVVYPVNKKELTAEEIFTIKQLFSNRANTAYAPVGERRQDIQPFEQYMPQQKPEKKFDVFEDFPD